MFHYFLNKLQIVSNSGLSDATSSPGPMSTPNLPTSHDAFPNTRWSLVLQAQKGSEAQASKALSELFSLYWYPIYGYVRRQGKSPHDAEDLTQGFFEVIIRRDALNTAEASRGKLRAFLLASLKNFLIDQHRRETTERRGGTNPLLSIDQEKAENRYALEPVHEDSPDVLFERSWAQTLLQDVMANLERSYIRAKKEAIFEAMSPFLLLDENPPYRQLCKTLGQSVVSLRILYHRMRQRFGEVLEQEIRHTVSSSEEAEEERAFLIKVLSEQQSAPKPPSG